MKVRRKFQYDPSCVLYLPLYELDGVSFMSKDKHGHLCTVTGATWGVQGRSFNGTSNYIDCGNSANLNVGIGDFTILVWGRGMGGVSTGWLYNKGVTASFGYGIFVADTDQITLFIKDSGGTLEIKAGPPVDDSSWHLFSMSAIRSGNASWYLDGVVTATGDISARNGNLDNATNARVGVRSSSDIEYFLGFIGEVLVYNRALSLAEIQHTYLTTKWRYQ